MIDPKMLCVLFVQMSAAVVSRPYASSLKAVNPLPALRHSSLITTIGSTPVIKLNRLAPEGVNVYVKAEALPSTLTPNPKP